MANTKMHVHKCVLFLYSLVSIAYSAPLSCEQLMQPADRLEPAHLEGRWALIGGSITYLPYLEIFRQRDSASISFPRNINGTNLSYTRGLRTDNKCLYSTSNITLNGSGFTFDGAPASNSSCTFVRTSCRDCLLMRFTVDAGQRTHLYLFSRRRGLSPAKVEGFAEQVQCHQMPPAAIMDPTKELCFEQTQESINEV